MRGCDVHHDFFRPLDCLCSVLSDHKISLELYLEFLGCLYVLGRKTIPLKVGIAGVKVMITNIALLIHFLRKNEKRIVSHGKKAGFRE
jgi:hypothetical protein